MSEGLIIKEGVARETVKQAKLVCGLTRRVFVETVYPESGKIFFPDRCSLIENLGKIVRRPRILIFREYRPGSISIYTPHSFVRVQMLM